MTVCIYIRSSSRAGRASLDDYTFAHAARSLRRAMNISLQCAGEFSRRRCLPKYIIPILAEMVRGETERFLPDTAAVVVLYRARAPADMQNEKMFRSRLSARFFSGYLWLLDAHFVVKFSSPRLKEHGFQRNFGCCTLNSAKKCFV